MEKLEKIAVKAVSKEKQPELYNGLVLVEEKVYSEGTSIKYWM